MFKTYHGVTGAEHRASFDHLFGLGYRIISLSVHGDPTDPRYAAAWALREGPSWVAIHGVDAARYEAFFNVATAHGFAPTLISAVGPVEGTVFAGVFERCVGGVALAKYGMPAGPAREPGTFQHFNAAARASRMMLRSVAIYGTANDPRYAAVWHPNPAMVKWHVHTAETAERYPPISDAETRLPYYRPAHLALGADHRTCVVFRDDLIGPWIARHGLTADEYQAEIDHQSAAGLYPICVEGGGSGGETRYAAIFAQRDVPLAPPHAAARIVAAELAGLDRLGIAAATIARRSRSTRLRSGAQGAPVATGSPVRQPSQLAISATSSSLRGGCLVW